jgi:DeoR family transcriptional regulator of aga operon
MASLDEFSREQVILAALRTTGRVAVNELAARFGVSSVTVRKDLDALERRTLLRRVRGGAVSLGASDEGSFEARFTDSRDRKQAIARATAAAVHDGDVIAIDSSTTAFYLAQEIVDRRGLVVVTNGLRLAMLLMEQSSARVLVLGGVLRRSAGSLVGPIGDVLTSRGRIAKGFFGLVGLSTVHGLMDISAEEAQTKHVMAAACDEVHGLFDSTKVHGFGFHPFAPADRVAALHTDDEASPGFVAEWRGRGVAVHTAPFRHRSADVVPLAPHDDPALRPGPHLPPHLALHPAQR